MNAGRRLGIVALAAALALAMGGCRTASGTVHGVVTSVGGPAPGGPRPMAGEVVVTLNGIAVARARTGDDGAFRFQLTPGDYVLSVDGLGCVREATVIAGRDRSADLVCSIK
jgi:hypothetical protein